MGPITFYISINDGDLFKICNANTKEQAIVRAMSLFNKEEKRLQSEYELASEEDKENWKKNWHDHFNIRKIEVFYCNND